MVRDPYKEIRQREYDQKIHKIYNNIKRFEDHTLPKRKKRKFLLKNGTIIEEVLNPIIYNGQSVNTHEVRGLSSIFSIISTNDPLPFDEAFLLMIRFTEPISPDYPFYGIYGPKYEVMKELDIESENQQ